GNAHRIDHLIRGSKGTLVFDAKGWTATDKGGKEIASHKKTGAEDMALHHTNFHNHLRHGEPLNCPVDPAVAAAAAVCMANESWRTNQMMAWDADKQQMVPANELKPSHLPDRPKS